MINFLLPKRSEKLTDPDDETTGWRPVTFDVKPSNETVTAARRFSIPELVEDDSEWKSKRSTNSARHKPNARNGASYSRWPSNGGIATRRGSVGGIGVGRRWLNWRGD